jgi:aspartate/methionine/tyrosine aminotransferase
MSKRSREVKRGPYREMEDTVVSLRAQGKKILTLKGAPYWLPPDHILEAAAKSARELPGAPSNGFAGLRRAIANKFEYEDGIVIDPESEILITAGGMHALYLAFTTFLDPGDEVVMYSPGFYFFGLIELAGAVPVYAQTRQENKWRWNAAELDKVISSRTKMIIVNSPTNPTGYVASESDLVAVAEIARRHDLLILSDECYDNMIYDGVRHLRFASVPGVKNRLITVCSFTKSYAMQPWRMGFMIASHEKTPYLRKVLEWNMLACNHVSQRAAQAALEGPQDWVRAIAPRYQRSRDLMISGLNAAPGISFAVPKGTTFLFLNTSGLGMSGEEFSHKLMDVYGVASEPGILFGSDCHVRLLFGGPDDDILEAAKRISKAAQELTKKGNGGSN